ncbi:hypothetical protein BJV78DRAFT_1219926 [Lactifluus subvellereus]|nr:hypothetical protein BJV78DRAFT_1219926 [Lactifluus subvellereus]
MRKVYPKPSYYCFASMRVVRYMHGAWGPAPKIDRSSHHTWHLMAIGSLVQWVFFF